MGTRSRIRAVAGAVTVAVITLWSLPSSFGATILVTNDFPTIQAAIDAAGSNDTIQVQAGTYREFLNIVAPVHIIGSGSTNCIVHHTNDVLVTISSAGTVELSGLEICGGEVAFGGGFSPTVPNGIVASNTTVALNDVAVNMTRNFAVTVVDGALYATNVALYTRIVLQQWDVGFQLKGCFARIYQLTQQAGQIDHTININDVPANFSDVRVENSTIQASHLDYGECIRTYTVSSVVISNCYLYRAPGGDPVTIGNQAIGVNGYSNTVVITDNVIDNLPTGIRIFGSLPNSNAIKIERNTITDCESNGVLISSMTYTGVDLGGGALQSAGQNYFYNPGERDVELSAMTAGVPAISNCWSTANPDDSIIDQLDTNILGRVSYSPTFCEITNVSCSMTPVLVTNVVDLFDSVGATVTTNGSPISGVAVTFNVSGAHNIGPTTLFTDTNGQAGITYLGTNFGTDTIVASGNIGLNAFSCQATKQWVGLPPQLTCPADIITNTAADTCARAVTYTASAVGTPTPVVTYDVPSGSSFSVGTTPVTVTASNAFGGTNCSFTVTVKDTEPPSITCAGDITTNIPFGQSHVNIFFGAPTASDNCGTVTTNCSPASGSAFALGTNTVTCTAIDTSANTNTCSFHVIVLGQSNPNVSCSMVPALVTNVVGLYDNVGITVTTNGNPAVGVPVTFNVSGAHNIGPTTLFTDANGQAGITYLGTNFGTDTILATGSVGVATFSCQATKQWIGLPPLLTCPANIVTNTAAGTCARTVTYTASAVGTPTPVITYSVPSGTSFSVGTTPVTVTASNAFGGTNCSFTVTVKDTEPPSITCAGDITTNILFGQSHVNIFFGAPTASDNCSTVTTNCSPASGSAFALGTNTVICTAIDSSSNTNTCSFHIIVLSLPNLACSLAPVLVTNVVGLFDQVGTMVTSNGSPLAGVPVTFTVSGANSVGPTNILTDANGQAGLAYLGSNFGTDTIVASGSIGLNGFSCQATKQWVGLPPIITCPADIITNTAAGTCARTVSYNANAVGLPAPVVTYDVPSGSSFPLGVTTITATASNAFGTTNCSFTVTVEDTELPSIACPGDITTNIAFGQTHANVTFGVPVASDNCGTFTISYSPASGGAFALGTNTVTCTAIDSSANTNTCSFNVIVQGPTHDLAVLSIAPPKTITLTTAKPSVTKPVKVTIENLGARSESIPDIATLTNVVGLAVESLGGCPGPAISPVTPKKGFPLVLAPKKKATLIYDVTFDCVNDAAAGPGHEDFRYVVTVDTTALDGRTDVEPSDNTCPRAPNPAIGDKGCGSKDPVTKHLGADVLTDVIQKP